MKNVVLSMLLCSSATGALAQTKSTPENVKQLLKLTGAAGTGGRLMNTTILHYREMLPQVDSVFWSDFRKSVDTAGLEEKLIPIYQQHYSNEDVLGLIRFYSSDLGRKVTSHSPLIMQESVNASRIWAKELSDQLTLQLREEGYFQRSSL